MSFRRKKNPICDCSRSYQMTQTDQIIEFSPNVRAPISELPYHLVTRKRLTRGPTFQVLSPTKDFLREEFI